MEVKDQPRGLAMLFVIARDSYLFILQRKRAGLVVAELAVVLYFCILPGIKL